jgi:hypothetical protein
MTIRQIFELGHGKAAIDLILRRLFCCRVRSDGMEIHDGDAELAVSQYESDPKPITVSDKAAVKLNKLFEPWLFRASLYGAIDFLYWKYEGTNRVQQYARQEPGEIVRIAVPMLNKLPQDQNRRMAVKASLLALKKQMKNDVGFGSFTIWENDAEHLFDLDSLRVISSDYAGDSVFTFSGMLADGDLGYFMPHKVKMPGLANNHKSWVSDFMRENWAMMITPHNFHWLTFGGVRFWRNGRITIRASGVDGMPWINVGKWWIDHETRRFVANILSGEKLRFGTGAVYRHHMCELIDPADPLHGHMSSEWDCPVENYISLDGQQIPPTHEVYWRNEANIGRVYSEQTINTKHRKAKYINWEKRTESFGYVVDISGDLPIRAPKVHLSRACIQMQLFCKEQLHRVLVWRYNFSVVDKIVSEIDSTADK